MLTFLVSNWYYSSLNCEQLLPLLYFIQYTNICTSFSGRLFDLSITDPKTISFALNKLWRINSLSFTVVKGCERIVCLLQNDAVHGKGWVHCCVFNRVWSQQSQLVQLLLLDHGRRTKNVDCSLEMSSGFYSKYPVFIGCTNILRSPAIWLGSLLEILLHFFFHIGLDCVSS